MYVNSCNKELCIIYFYTGSHPDSYLLGTRGYVPGGKVAGA